MTISAISILRCDLYFDRLYLPNGMWDVMGTAGQELMADILTPLKFQRNSAVNISGSGFNLIHRELKKNE